MSNLHHTPHPPLEKPASYLLALLGKKCTHAQGKADSNVTCHGYVSLILKLENSLCFLYMTSELHNINKTEALNPAWNCHWQLLMYFLIVFFICSLAIPRQDVALLVSVRGGRKRSGCSEISPQLHGLPPRLQTGLGFMQSW